MEVAQYSVKPSVAGILLPQFFKLAALCACFYGGVWINFFILGKEIPFWIALLVVSVLAALFVAQLLITKSRAGKYHYDFFSNRVEFYGSRMASILYSDVEGVKISRSVFDRISGTGTIVLSKNFKISTISNYQEIQNYLNQIVQSFKSYRAAQFSAQYAGG